MSGGSGGGTHGGHNLLLGGGDRFGQQQHLLFNNVQQQQNAVAAARAQQQHNMQQQQNIIGLIGRDVTSVVSAVGRGGVTGGGIGMDRRGGGGLPVPTPVERPMIRDVWAADLEKEMAVLRDLVDSYQYVAMVSFSGLPLPLREAGHGHG